MNKGQIYWGSNNIFSLKANGEVVECRLKGKVLKTDLEAYNPLAPGDWVHWEEDVSNPGHGMILDRLERTNAFTRWNNKRGCPQTIAANVDLLILVASPLEPPFRPRFLDRALIMADYDHIEPLILVNKIDQELTSEAEDRLAYYQDMGYQVHTCSAQTGEGLEILRELLNDKTAAFVGQSGVGKSSLLNALDPTLGLKVGDLSAKYNKGSHTTVTALMRDWALGRLIDTPGIRELEVFGMVCQDLDHYFRDFVPLLGHCDFVGCSHLHEPGCVLKGAALDRTLHPDRLESYAKLYFELKETEKGY